MDVTTPRSGRWSLGGAFAFLRTGSGQRISVALAEWVSCSRRRLPGIVDTAHGLRAVALGLSIAVAFTLAVVHDGPAQEILTNDSVLIMVRAGLPESVILAKIRSTPSRFDLRAEALVGLKQAGVPGKVLEATVTPVAALPGPPPALSPAASPAPAISPPPEAAPSSGLPPLPAGTAVLSVPPPIDALRGRGTVYQLIGCKYVELTPTLAEVQSNFVFFYQKSELVVHGRRAHDRITDRQPVFYSSYAASELQLVRLKPGDEHDDRNLKISSGTAVPFMGVTQRRGVRAEDSIEVGAEKDAQGSYRVRPRSPLGPGEYGFVLTHGFAAGATTGQLYDFGVD